ncbi:peptidase S8/S53 domain-containing protein [Xylaria sp. CBS 124048]|nr:peptidase S8/S53 domain-containing protein [Xylaria sp. CBS 124048]
MKLLTGSSLLAAVLCTPFASAFTYDHHVLHEKRDVVPAHWTKLSAAKGSQPLELRIALKQANLHRAEEYMNDVSHPDSENFGKFWTPEQVIDAFAPSAEALADTTKWLLQMGVTQDRIAPSAGRNWLKVNSTVAEAEKLLKTTYNVYQNDEGTVLIACESYAVPSNVQSYIDFVSPTTQFDTRMPGTLGKKKVAKRDSLAPRIKGAKAGSKATGLENCSSLITPACLRAMYDIPEVTEAVEGNSFGIMEFAPQSYNQVDLNGFFSVYAQNVPNNTAPVFDAIDGGYHTNETGSGARGESNLDLCYAMALTHPQEVTLYQVGDSVAFNAPTYNNFLDAIDGSYCTFEGGDNPDWDAIYPHNFSQPGAYHGKPMCGTYKAANVISVSYGGSESGNPPAYNERECMEYMKLGLMGVSMVFASGDTGTAGNSGQCLGPGGVPLPVSAASGHFDVLFPASCPWVTTVGGANLPRNGTVKDRQVVAQDFVPGGGFSNLFGIPDYQKAAVAAYYAAHNPGYNASVYNNSQIVRGLPDVAVASQNFITGLDGGFMAFTGTSAAAPTFASMIALINGDRIKAGKGPVGFLNKILYAHPQIFDDIVEGRVDGCGSEGFKAVPGWDPASGLGAPNYMRLREVLMALP